MLGEENRSLGYMLGEGNEPPYPSPSGDGSLPPGHSLRSLGGPTPVGATPADDRDVCCRFPQAR